MSQATQPSVGLISQKFSEAFIAALTNTLENLKLFAKEEGPL